MFIKMRAYAKTKEFLKHLLLKRDGPTQWRVNPPTATHNFVHTELLTRDLGTIPAGEMKN